MPNERIKFTVITAVYNCDRYIRDTVNSVLRFAPQGDFEYIVVNDGSTDETANILREYGDQVKVINQENFGEANAVNKGLEYALGKYCLVVSADDPLVSSRLFSLAAEVLDARSEIVGTYPDWQMIDANGSVLRIVKTVDYSFDKMLGLNICIPGPGTIFRLAAAREINGRNTSLRFGSDFDFWLRLSALGELHRIPEHLAQWRIHDESTSIKSRGVEMARERVAIIENFLSQRQVSEDLSRKALGNAYYSAAILRYFDRMVPHRKLLYKAFYYRRSWVENARIHEIVYLAFIPISETLWNVVKRIYPKNGLPT